MEETISDDQSNDILSCESPRKLCKVCGDKAKSFHFGGFCCESCKAFFRRAMLNDNYKYFNCSQNQVCEIDKSSRRFCQYCRIQKCFSIGMDKGWLRTEAEILKLRELKLTKKKECLVNKPGELLSEPMKTPYQPNFEEVYTYMSHEDVQFLQKIVELYSKAYKEIPYGAEVMTNNGVTNSSGVQVISMFTTGIRRWATFSQMLPEFSMLIREDQMLLLQAAAMQLSILRSVAAFKISDKVWFGKCTEQQPAPILRLEDVKRLLSTELAEMHVEFISSMQKLQVDEPTLMLLSLITLFNSEKHGLINTQMISNAQDYYILLLRRYCNWKYGLDDKHRTHTKLLAKMSDLRALSDVHSDHQVRLSMESLKQIYNAVDNPIRPPHLNMNLDNRAEFLSALEFSILKSSNTIKDEPERKDPAFHDLEFIEQICAGLGQVGNDK